MSQSPSIIERAYQLARSGDYPSIPQIADRLKAERFDSVDAHLASATLRRDLRKLLSAAKVAAAATAS
jgi:hypothetical protein